VLFAGHNDDAELGPAALSRGFNWKCGSKRRCELAGAACVPQRALTRNYGVPSRAEPRPSADRNANHALASISLPPTHAVNRYAKARFPPQAAPDLRSPMSSEPSNTPAMDAPARAFGWVVLANLIYFGIEFAVATTIGSVSLFADSIDFLEDAALNGLIWSGLNWSARARARLGFGLALILLIPGLATLSAAWNAWSSGHVPRATPLSVTGLGAFAVNFGCAWILARVRHLHGSLGKAAFLSARNDVIANVAILAAGGLTAFTASRWPDLVVGLGIFAMNLGAAREVYLAARAEHRAEYAARWW
jgi:Cation efflux family